MFKKPVSISRQHPLKGSALRALAATLEGQWPVLDASLVRAVLEAPTLCVCHLQGSRTLIYARSVGVGAAASRTPLFFDLDSRGILYPTVFALWELDGVPLARFLIHGATFEFLANGADLMLPGLVHALAPSATHAADSSNPATNNSYTWRSSEVVAIALASTRVPLAVARATVSSDGARLNAFKGKAAEVLHFFGDALCALAPTRAVPASLLGATPIPIPIPIPKSESEAITESASKDPNDAVPFEVRDEKGAPEGASAKGNDNIEDEVKAEAEVEGEEEEVEAEAEEEEGESSSLVSHSQSSRPPRPSAEEVAASKAAMDAWLWRALVQALRKVRDADLPLPLNSFYVRFVVRESPRDAQRFVDVKLSSHKKLLALMRHAQAQELCALEEISEGVHVLVKVLRAAPAVKEHTVHEVHVELQSDTSEHSESSAEAKVEGIEELWRLPSPLLFLLRDPNVDKHALYSMPELTKVLWDYCAAEVLSAAKDKSCTRLNEALWEALFGPKSGLPTSAEVPKRDLLERLKGRLSPYHAITVQGARVVHSGAIPQVQVAVETRQGARKHVTRVSGLTAFRINGARLAHALSVVCAASASVQDDDSLIVQGNRAAEAQQILAERYALPARCVNVTYAKGAKPPKKQ